MLIRANSFADKMSQRSLIDEQILAMLRDLSGDISGNDGIRSDNDFYEEYAILGLQENTSEDSESWHEPSDPNGKAGSREADYDNINPLEGFT